MTDRIAVVGAGQMGNGIAHVFAQCGFPVTMIDVSQDALDRGRSTIAKNIERQIKKGSIPAQKQVEILSRVDLSMELDAAAEASLIIEAASEDSGLKYRIFTDVDRIAKPDAILATNTSSISITEIARRTNRPDKVIGMHFMNPVPVMTLVEVIRGIATSDETYRHVEELAKKMGKTPIEVNDYPGFISNRVLMPMINEAIFALYEGVATPESIDGVMKLGMNHPMGPLTLADFIGLDVCLAILRVLEEGFGDPKYRPCPLLVKMVDAGWLGKKSGRGFYRY
jgi:3-hydroxybutyryl-CoA dehydrogenase